MRPRSAASLPDSTTSTGLLCLSVGAREHRGRSNIEVDCVATTVHILHSVHDIYMLVILTIRLFKWQIVCCDLLACKFISILKFETPVYWFSKNIKNDGHVL